MSKLVNILIVLILMAGSANAATTYVWSECYGDGTFDVIASVSPGDNGGLAIYNIPLVCPETGDLCNLDNTYPNPGSIKNLGPAQYFQFEDIASDVGGFVLFRSSQGIIPANPLGAMQDSIQSIPAGMIYHVGQAIIDITHPIANVYIGHPNPPTVVGIPLDGLTAAGDGIVHIRPDDLPAAHQYGIVLGQGVTPADCSAGCCYPDVGGEYGGGMTVFDNDSGFGVSFSAVVNLGCVPEPATLALLLVGGFLVLKRRKF